MEKENEAGSMEKATLATEGVTNPIMTKSDQTNKSTTKSDQTLAEQLAEDQHKMFMRSQDYMQEIEAEIRQTQPLVSPREPISALVDSYDVNESTEFYFKAVELAETYSEIRRIRGDGNCFYRAVLTAILERCMADRAELNRITQICKAWRPKLFAFGFPELTTGDFCDAMDIVLESIRNGTTSMEFLFGDLNQDSIANYYVAFIRLITSGYLREKESDFAGFIEGGRSMDQYCKDEVEPMWRDCDHICIIALVNALRTPIRIEYMDRSQAPNGGWHHDVLINEPGEDEQRQPALHFLYRPGHYDILYPNTNKSAATETKN